MMTVQSYINGKRAAALDDTAVAPDKTALCHLLTAIRFTGVLIIALQITFEAYDLSMLKQGKIQLPLSCITEMRPRIISGLT